MEKKLYFCEYWEPVIFENKRITVSDVVYSNEKKYFQIHAIVLCKKEVFRINQSIAIKIETQIKHLLQNKIIWSTDSINKSVIKIWYYNIDDSPVTSENIPLRLAITALDVESFHYDSVKDEIIRILNENT